MLKLFNFILFQTGWFIVIYGAVNGTAWLGPAFIIAWVIGYEYYCRTPFYQRLKFYPTAIILGLVCDSFLAVFDLIQFPHSESSFLPVPFWMIALWINFAATLNGCLVWLADRIALAAVLGFIGGPLAYFAGMKLGAVAFPQPTLTTAITIGLEWALAMPTLLWLNKEFSFHQAKPHSAEMKCKEAEAAS